MTRIPEELSLDELRRCFQELAERVETLQSASVAAPTNRIQSQRLGPGFQAGGSPNPSNQPVAPPVHGVARIGVPPHPPDTDSIVVLKGVSLQEPVSTVQVLSVVEKIQLKPEVDQMLKTQGIYDSEAASLTVDASGLDGAITNLLAFLSLVTPQWDDMTVSSDLGYDGRTTLAGLKNEVYRQIDALGGALRNAWSNQAVSQAATTAMQKSVFLDVNGQIPANTHITPNSITSPLIAANAILAKNLVVANFDNLVPNPTSELDPTGLDTQAIELAGVSTAAAYAGTKSRALAGGAGTTNLVITPKIACFENEQFYFEAMSKLSTAAGNCSLVARFFDASGTQIGSAMASTTNATTAWTKVLGSTGAAPVGTASLTLELSSSAIGVGNTAYFDNFYLRRMADASVIVDGTITASKLAANLVIATVIKTSNYTVDGSGNPTAGAAFDGTDLTYPLKAASAQFARTVRIGSRANGYILGDLSSRVFQAIQSTTPIGVDPVSTDRVWYRGNNDPTVNGGAPVIVDPLWARDTVYTAGQRVVAGSSAAVPTYANGLYVYICTAGGAGVTTALATAAAWSSLTTYAAGNNVTSGNRSYTSKLNTNTNHTPAVGGDIWWQDNGSIFGPQGTNPTNPTTDNAAQWTCVGWMWGSSNPAGCKPYIRSTAYALGDLICADPGTAGAYDAGYTKLYGADPYITAPFDPNSLGLNIYAGKRIYRCITAGTTSASGAGPTGTGSSIADGTATFAYFSENTGPENRLQLWGGAATTGGTQGYADIEFRIVPKTSSDNLDSITHILVEPRDSLGHTLMRTDGTTFNEIAISLPFSRIYAVPGTNTSTQNRVRVTHQFTSNQNYIFVNASPFGVDMKLRCRVFNISGCSDAHDFIKWNNQNLAPCPYTLVSGTLGGSAPPSGGGSGGSGGCPELWVKILTTHGEVEAGEIKVGMKLYGFHEESERWGYWPVTHVSLEDNETAMLKLKDREGMAFAINHRFMRNGQWTQLQELIPGDTLEGLLPGIVESITARGLNPVVRITVEQSHTYTTDGILSHNIKPS